MESVYLLVIDNESKEVTKAFGYMDAGGFIYDHKQNRIKNSDLLFFGTQDKRDLQYEKYLTQKSKTAEEVFLPKYDSLQKQVGGGHYKNMVIPPAEYIIKNNISWIEGDAIVYISRHSSKNGAEDLKKAIQCLEIALEFYYPNEAK